MPVKREWIDPRLAGTEAVKHCTECNREITMSYQRSFERTDGDLRDIYKCLGDCPAKCKYQAENPDMQWVNPLFSYSRKIK